MRKVMIFLFTIYIFLLIIILFRPYRLLDSHSIISISENLRFKSNFIPFKTILGYTKSFMDGTISKSIFISNIIGNILLFIPMGVLLPSIVKKFRKFSKFITMMLITVVIIEVVQLLAGVGSIDIDDIILNTLGTVISFWIWQLDINQKVLRKLHIIEENN